MVRAPTVLFSSNPVQVEFTPATPKITLGYRQEEARKVMMLKDSSNKSVKDMHAQVVIGRKWIAEEEVQRMVSRLQYQEVEGSVQTTREVSEEAERASFWLGTRHEEQATPEGG